MIIFHLIIIDRILYVHTAVLWAAREKKFTGSPWLTITHLVSVKVAIVLNEKGLTTSHQSFSHHSIPTAM